MGSKGAKPVRRVTQGSGRRLVQMSSSIATWPQAMRMDPACIFGRTCVCDVADGAGPFLGADCGRIQ